MNEAIKKALTLAIKNRCAPAHSVGYHQICPTTHQVHNTNTCNKWQELKGYNADNELDRVYDLYNGENTKETER